MTVSKPFHTPHVHAVEENYADTVSQRDDMPDEWTGA